MRKQLCCMGLCGALLLSGCSVMRNTVPTNAGELCLETANAPLALSYEFMLTGTLPANGWSETVSYDLETKGDVTATKAYVATLKGTATNLTKQEETSALYTYAGAYIVPGTNDKKWTIYKSKQVENAETKELTNQWFVQEASKEKTATKATTYVVEDVLLPMVSLDTMKKVREIDTLEARQSIEQTLLYDFITSCASDAFLAQAVAFPEPTTEGEITSITLQSTFGEAIDKQRLRSYMASFLTNSTPEALQQFEDAYNQLYASLRASTLTISVDQNYLVTSFRLQTPPQEEYAYSLNILYQASAITEEQNVPDTVVANAIKSVNSFEYVDETYNEEEALNELRQKVQTEFGK